jgi:hypothetical protein
MLTLLRRGKDLKELVDLSREGTTVILDEVSSHVVLPVYSDILIRRQFYSWYIYPENGSDFGKSISSAKYIEDVNEVSNNLSSKNNERRLPAILFGRTPQ